MCVCVCVGGGGVSVNASISKRIVHQSSIVIPSVQLGQSVKTDQINRTK